MFDFDLSKDLRDAFIAVEGSYFDKFYKKTADMDPVQVISNNI
jgi:hypothetical protein